jgi:predicted dehydrogenase
VGPEFGAGPEPRTAATLAADRQPRLISDIKAAIVGFGFIGAVHLDALRRLGVEIVGVCPARQEIPDHRVRAHALPRVYDRFEQILDDDAVDVVHIATPNYLHHSQARAALAAGKHVVCEKPLALTSAESSELVALAGRSGLVHCTNFNVRFYPQCHEARQRIRDGEIGEIWDVRGCYLQDWLALPNDWNWRLDPQLGGPLRAMSDIGSHWLDLAQFLTGRRITALLADLHTAIPTRERPVGSVQTFAETIGRDRESVEVHTEDAAHLLLRFADGLRGSCTLSQVSAGRRNTIAFEVDGSEGSLAWNSERNEELWLGHRDRANETLWRDPALMTGPLRGSVPAGHHEGFQDTFKHLYAAVYRAVAGGEPGTDYPTFNDGHQQNLLGEAALRSHREQRWVEVPVSAVRSRPG